MVINTSSEGSGDEAAIGEGGDGGGGGRCGGEIVDAVCAASDLGVAALMRVLMRSPLLMPFPMVPEMMPLLVRVVMVEVVPVAVSW